MSDRKDYKHSRNFKDILPVLLVFFMGALTGSLLQKYLLPKNPAQEKANMLSEKRVGDSNHLTNPLLECEQSIGSDGGLELIKYKIEDYIKNKTRDKKIAHVSVYIRDLNNGPWIGVNEDEGFSPASLLKVPLMMAYFKAAQEDPEILSQVILYKNAISDGATPNIMPEKQIQVGNAYAVSDLIYRMIVYSDNEAKNLLLLNLKQDILDQVYTDLNIAIPDFRDKEDFISVKDYASFFRILYNASYLNREMSEKALNILTEVDFDEGLLAGLPPNIKVAHKFGERVNVNTGLAQLHECGIVYHRKSPYLLGVMTRGEDLDNLKAILKDISRIVYEHKEKYND
ncbi:MAG: class A beta-lactamase-related serine hydrolase [Candidatus Omnitrophica bacterium]|nr:class A beta-lactamase-related serine hydrolase [Candidatus Omnitrophota bacterium]